MGWNYRVIKTKLQYIDETTIGHPISETEYYAIHEVHYENDKPRSYTSNPVKPEAFMEFEDSKPLADIRWQLEKMLVALDKPVLTPEDFEKK